jgi:hypothetical protein
MARESLWRKDLSSSTINIDRSVGIAAAMNSAIAIDASTDATPGPTMLPEVRQFV